MAIKIVHALKVLSVVVVLLGCCAAENGSPAPGQITGDNGSPRPRILRAEPASPRILPADSSTASHPKLSTQSFDSASSKEIDGIEQTLERYQSAFENLSLRQVRQVWPSLDRGREAKFKEVFKAFRSTAWTRKLGMSCAAPVFAGEAASVECEETLTYGASDETPREVGPNRVAISLKKSSNAWVVENMKGLD
jgi:hypothetical protein